MCRIPLTLTPSLLVASSEDPSSSLSISVCLCFHLSLSFLITTPTNQGFIHSFLPFPFLFTSTIAIKMGRIFVIELEGRTYKCKFCKVHFALADDLVSKLLFSIPFLLYIIFFLFFCFRFSVISSVFSFCFLFILVVHHSSLLILY